MLGRRMALVFYAKILRQALGLVAVMFTGRLLGPEVMGLTGFAQAFIGLVWFLAEFGMEPTHAKLIHETGDVESCVGALAVLKIAFSVVAAVVVLGWLGIYAHQHPFENPEQVTVILLWLAGNVIANLSNIATYTFTARKEVAKSETVEIVETIISLIFNVAIALAMRNGQPYAATMLAAAYIGSNLFSFALSLYMLRGIRLRRPSKDLLKRYLSFASSMAIIAAFTSVVLYVDRVMIGTYYSEKEVGWYHAATRLNRILLFFSGAAMTILTPSFFEHVAKRNFEGVRDLMYKAERYLSLVVTLCVMEMIICARPLVRITLGDQYDSSIIILQIISIIALVSTLGRPVSAFIITMNRPRVYIAQTAGSVVAVVILNFLMVPKVLWGIPMLGWGGMGAALNTAVVSVISLIIGKVIIWRWTKIAMYWGVFKHLGAALLTGAVAMGLQRGLGYSDWVAVPVNTIGGTLSYFLLLYFSHEFSKADVLYIYGNVHPTVVRQYAGDELRGPAADGDKA